jgi:glycosyltransferase involved in cell wall biosynthesis
VSVVVPVRDGERTLATQLRALAEQDYADPWEVLVADNGSADRSAQIARRHLRALPDGRLVDAARRAGAAHARNAGARAARGDFLAFCDADDRVGPGWLSGMAHSASEGEVVAGRLVPGAFNDAHTRAAHGSGGWGAGPPVALRFLPFASGSNCGIWSSAFARLDGFDETLAVGEDIDLSWRAQLAGMRLVFGATAVVERRYASGARAIARQHYRYGQAAARLFARHRAEGVPRTPPRVLAGEWAGLAAGIVRLPASRSERGRWARRAALRSGHLVGSVRNRVVYL